MFKKHYDWLKKQSIAQVTFNVVKHPKDDRFDSENPPVACVFTYSGSTDAEIKKTLSYNGMIPCDHPVVVQMKSLTDSIMELTNLNSSIRGKKIIFNLIPASGWEEYYETTTIERVYISGGCYTENVSFIPISTKQNKEQEVSKNTGKIDRNISRRPKPKPNT